MADQIETLTPLEDILQPEGPYYELLLCWDENPHREVGHVCNQCGRDVMTGPCPEHAPRDVPGLQLIPCDATPRHWLWMPAGDYYEPPCYRCEMERAYDREQERRDAPHRRSRHSYRRAALWRWLTDVGDRIGLVRGRSMQTCPGGGWCYGARWRWSR